MKTTRFRELADGLRLIADMFDEAELEIGALAAPVDISLYVTTEFGGNDEARKQAVDQLALITGQEAGWDKNLSSGDGDHAYWSTRLDSQASSVATLTAKAYIKRPNPADDLRAENERLRARLAELEAAEEPDEQDDDTWWCAVHEEEFPSCNGAAGVPCAPTFYNMAIGERPGFVPGECGHAVALSEWRAGFRVCERCPKPEPAPLTADEADAASIAATDPGELPDYDGPCMDPQCGDSTWDHECPLPPVDGGWWVTNGVTHRGEPSDATSGSGLAT